jgi:hypothetical protein
VERDRTLVGAITDPVVSRLPLRVEVGPLDPTDIPYMHTAQIARGYLLVLQIFAIVGCKRGVTMQAVQEHIRRAIAAEIETQGLTPYKLATLVNCPPNTLYVYLKGRRGISLDLLGRIMEKLDLEIRRRV